MNFVAGILIVIACTYIGIGFDNFYKSKIKILKDFSSFIDFAVAEISYLKTDLFSLINKNSNLNPSKFSRALLTINNPVDFSTENLSLGILNLSEKNLIISFIKDLSRLDTEAQKAFAEEYKQRVSGYIKNIEEEESKKGKLAKKLAPLLGLGIMIIII
jgi:stage III sporulation protein AB